MVCLKSQGVPKRGPVSQNAVRASSIGHKGVLTVVGCDTELLCWLRQTRQRIEGGCCFETDFSSKLLFSMTNEQILARLDTFSDATDLVNTLMLLFLRHYSE